MAEYVLVSKLCYADFFLLASKLTNNVVCKKLVFDFYLTFYYYYSQLIINNPEQIEM